MNYVVDTRFTRLLGPICKSAELISGLISQGHTVTLLVSSSKGFDSFSGGKQFTWNSSHPASYFLDLIKPTFGDKLNIRVLPPLSRISKLGMMIVAVFNKKYFIHYDYAWGSLSEKTFDEFRLRHKLEITHGKGFSERLGSFFSYVYVYLKPWRRKPIAFSPFVYKPCDNFSLPNKCTEFIQRFPIRLLISSTWDDQLNFEPIKERARGVDYIESEFESMVSFVHSMAERYGNEIGFVLASKKAVDWPKILPESQILDLRDFEAFDLSLGQSIYTSCFTATHSISWPSTYCIWVTGQENIKHVVFGGDRDVVLSNSKNIFLSPSFDYFLNSGGADE